MKAISLLAALSFTFWNYSTCQILCVSCYNQNDSISYGVNNLLLNGGFETNNCGAWPAPSSYYCPNSNYYSCNISNWTCTGGGTSTYACIFDHTYVTVPQGNDAVYFGNFFCNACSPNSEDTSCVNTIGCTTTGIPAGYPVNDITYGGTNGVSLEQTVNGLVVGNTYVLEFWVGGEWTFTNSGLFAVDLGFGDTMLRCKPTPTGSIGTVYLIQFSAAASSQTIKFTNWGHICSTCTELVLDNVRLYKVAELSSSVPPCGPSASTSFTASDTTVCEKFCVSYFDSSTNDPTAWQWYFPGGSPSSSTDQNPSAICYTTPGTYDVTLITTTVNGNDTLTLPNYITVNPTPPFPAIVQVGYTLTSSPANSYQWQLNSANIPGATNQSYTALQSGYYTVIAGDANGCVNSFTTYVLISGIQDVAADANLSIYPNPSAGSFNVELLNGRIGDEVCIDVKNTLGQKVFSSREKISAPDFKKEIDLTAGRYEMSDAIGIYFIEIKTENEFVSRKIIVVK